MDTGLTLKPSASPAQTSDVRPEPAARAVAPTELEPAKAVTPVPEGAQIQATEDQRKREIVLDPHSREVIYRIVDVRSQRVVRQIPEEAMLRLRAYTRAALDKSSQAGLDTTA